MKFKPLDRKEVKSVINGHGKVHRIPMMIHFWVHPEDYGPREKEVREIIKDYPEDIKIIELNKPELYISPKNNYSWVNWENPWPEKKNVDVLGLDGFVPIDSWKQLDELLHYFPKPDFPGLFPKNIKPDDSYSLGHWWFGLFEMHWRLRGMKNALMDYYTNPSEVHSLFRAITDLYIGYIKRCKEEMNLDGVFTSDDMGMQTGTFFSLDVFNKFFLPYYKEMVGTTKKYDMDHWLHACGHIEPFLPGYLEAGIDVIHPIQKYTMDEKIIVEKYGDKFCFYTGIDVQKILVFGKPEEVRDEVRFIMDLFWGDNGRLIYGAGNGINNDTPIDNLVALFDEAYSYGSRIVK
jgi:uroporphyrinogen decarboxylase